jgi:predicted kinase
LSTLYILAGLPGTGKSTIARALSRKAGAVWLRIDTIEQGLIESGISRDDIYDKGYRIAYAIAADNLRCGQSVIADSVNPLPITRAAWRSVATDTNAGRIEIEIACSKTEEHRRRIAERQSDIPNMRLPTWTDIQEREYHQWVESQLRIDTAKLSVEDAVNAILKMKAITPVEDRN